MPPRIAYYPIDCGFPPLVRPIWGFLCMSDDSLHNALRVINSIDVNGVDRKDELGREFAFFDLYRTIVSARKVTDTIADEIFHEIPIDLQFKAANALNLIASMYGLSRNFSVAQGNAKSEHERIEAVARAQVAELYLSLAPVVSLHLQLSASKGEADSALERLESERREVRELWERTSDEAGRILASLNDVLASSRSASAELATIVEAEHFGEASSKYAEIANRWLIASGIMLAIVVIVSGVFIFFSLDTYIVKMTNYALVNYVGSKILFIAILLYVTNSCVRSYFANKHNEIVNAHRKNAIMSYRALVVSATAVEAKDIILSHAASAIFSPQDTAFVRGGSAPEVPTNIVNAFGKLPGTNL